MFKGLAQHLKGGNAAFGGVHGFCTSGSHWLSGVSGYVQCCKPCALLCQPASGASPSIYSFRLFIHPTHPSFLSFFPLPSLFHSFPKFLLCWLCTVVSLFVTRTLINSQSLKQPRTLEGMKIPPSLIKTLPHASARGQIVLVVLSATDVILSI